MGNIDEVIDNLIVDVFNDDGFEEEELFLQELAFEIAQGRENRVAVSNYHNETIPNMSNEAFRSHFRLDRTSFYYLLEIIGEDLVPPAQSGRPRTPADLQLQMALWQLCNQEVHRKTALLYDVSKATAWTSTLRVCESVMNRIDEFITWPTVEEAQDVMAAFEEVEGVPGIVGAIDVAHINVSKPLYNANFYADRHDNMSVKLQGICDRFTRFLDVYAGETGCMHDSRVFRRSPIRQLLHNPQTRAQFLPLNSYIIGDKAYELTEYLMTPYRNNGNLNAVKRLFNRKHSSTRMSIERAFGLLKGRFRCLSYLYRFNMEIVPLVIVTCCALHNLCIDMNDGGLFENPYVVVNDFAGLPNNLTGLQKRNHLAELL